MTDAHHIEAAFTMRGTAASAPISPPCLSTIRSTRIREPAKFCRQLTRSRNHVRLLEGPARADVKQAAFVGGGEQPGQQLGSGVIQREAERRR